MVIMMVILRAYFFDVHWDLLMVKFLYTTKEFGSPYSLCIQ